MLFSGTIQQNVLFNRPYDPVWYNKVVRACGLIGDISVLPFGDHTNIENTGWTLDLDRKARISLARFVKLKTTILTELPGSCLFSVVQGRLWKCGYLPD